MERSPSVPVTSLERADASHTIWLAPIAAVRMDAGDSIQLPQNGPGPIQQNANQYHGLYTRRIQIRHFMTCTKLLERAAP